MPQSPQQPRPREICEQCSHAVPSVFPPSSTVGHPSFRATFPPLFMLHQPPTIPSGQSHVISLMKTDSSVINVRALQTISSATRAVSLSVLGAPLPPRRRDTRTPFTSTSSSSSPFSPVPAGMTSHLNWCVANWVSNWLRPATPRSAVCSPMSKVPFRSPISQFTHTHVLLVTEPADDLMTVIQNTTTVRKLQGLPSTLQRCSRWLPFNANIKNEMKNNINRSEGKESQQKCS